MCFPINKAPADKRAEAVGDTAFLHVARRPKALADKRAEAVGDTAFFSHVARRPKAPADKRAEARRAIPFYFGGAGESPAKERALARD